MEIIIKDTCIEYNSFEKNYNNIDFFDTLLFDIETTGFMAKNTHLYMIGALYVCSETKTFKTIQWFLDDYNDEKALIQAFKQFLSKYSTLLHFNGKGFDIPYLEDKAKILDIELDFNNFIHIDLYKHAKKLKRIFKTENLKLKTLEEFFGLNRTDEFSGKELIDLYKEYMHLKDDKLKEFLVLHNFEDLQGMLTVINILAYDNIFNNIYDFTSLDVTDNKEIIIELTLSSPLLKRISHKTDHIYLTAYDNKLKLMINLYSGTLKFFYDNYKDYYYLPEEDMAIHKSLASFVDKNFREKAKATNCYTKKDGIFLPQFNTKISPAFKENYNDKLFYFEFTDDFKNNELLIIQYCAYILEYIYNFS